MATMIGSATTWHPNRKRFAATAVLVGTLTAALLTRIAEPGWSSLGAGGFVLICGLALFFPAAIVFLVITGQVLIGVLLVRQDGPTLLLLTPAMAGVVLTAELLAVVARMDTPFEAHPRADLPRGLLTAVIGGGVFAAVAALGTLGGPVGLWAVVLASAACLVLAVVMVRKGE